MSPSKPHKDILEQSLQKAKLEGADSADTLIVAGHSLSLNVRKGVLEELEHSNGQQLGLRVFVGKRQAVAATSDLSEKAISTLAERVVAMAKIAPEDPYAGLPETNMLAQPPFPDLDLVDQGTWDQEALLSLAKEAEEAALSVEGVSNTEGAGASSSHGALSYMASNGFSGAAEGTSFSLMASVLAGEGTGMERDYEYSTARHRSDVKPAQWIGKTAGERAVRRLNARKVGTKKVPVVFETRIAGGLLGHLASAINGRSVARGGSFLENDLGKPVFRKDITVIDNPTIKRGLKSKPFDAEGIAASPLSIIEDGVLKSWVMDTSSAKQLGLQTTGHASRSASSAPAPSVTNLYMQKGKLSPKSLISDIEEGFFITEVFGMGVNTVTGDYSRGAAGFWIEKGKISYPVSEITIAGNLRDMFMKLTPANDLEMRAGINAPTVRIDQMMVAGS